MFIVKRKCQARDWPNLPDGSEIDQTLGVVEDIEDAKKLLVILQHEINNDKTITEGEDGDTYVADLDESGDTPTIIVYSEDLDLIWFTIELEPIVLLDHDTIENRLTEAIGG